MTTQRKTNNKEKNDYTIKENTFIQIVISKGILYRSVYGSNGFYFVKYKLNSDNVENNTIRGDLRQEKDINKGLGIEWY